MRNDKLGPFIRWCTDCHRIFFDTRDWVDHKNYLKTSNKHQTHRLIIERREEFTNIKYLQKALVK